VGSGPVVSRSNAQIGLSDQLVMGPSRWWFGARPVSAAGPAGSGTDTAGMPGCRGRSPGVSCPPVCSSPRSWTALSREQGGVASEWEANLRVPTETVPPV